MSSLIDPIRFTPLMTLSENWRIIRDECAALDCEDILDLDRTDKDHEMVAKALVEKRPGLMGEGVG